MLMGPASVAVDDCNAAVYVSDTTTNRISVLVCDELYRRVLRVRLPAGPVGADEG